jgi:hypothetical protein
MIRLPSSLELVNKLVDSFVLILHSVNADSAARASTVFDLLILTLSICPCISPLVPGAGESTREAAPLALLL